jgi:hypothetical protein
VFVAVVIDRPRRWHILGMPRPAPLALALLGLLATACETPESDESNDEQATETETDESDGTTDESDSTSESSSDDAESSSDDADTMDTTETTETTEGTQCECIPPTMEDLWPEFPSCGDALCDVAMVVADPESEWEEPMIANPEAVDCALMALRDRTPGVLTWDEEYSFGMYTESGYVLIYDGGEAVHRDWGVDDLNYWASEALRFELLAPEVYEACLADPDPLSRYGCLTAPPQVELEVCDPGWEHSI